jgi:hypothetical protein
MQKGQFWPTLSLEHRDRKTQNAPAAQNELLKAEIAKLKGVGVGAPLCKIDESEHIRGAWVRRSEENMARFKLHMGPLGICPTAGFDMKVTQICDHGDPTGLGPNQSERGCIGCIGTAPACRFCDVRSTACVKSLKNLGCEQSRWCDFYHSQGECEFNVSNRNADSFTWQPENCRLIDWDPTKFCSALGTRKVLMVGDSTMMQMAGTFWQMAAVGSHPCHNQFFYAPGDQLKGLMGDRGKLWSVYAEEMNADIVLLTGGAHIGHAVNTNGNTITEADAGFTDWFEEILKSACSLRNKRPLVQIFWVGAFPAGCGTNIAHTIKTNWTEHNWAYFPLRLQYTRKILGSNLYKQRTCGMRFLDTEPLYYREDAHPGSFGDSSRGDCVSVDWLVCSCWCDCK